MLIRNPDNILKLQPIIDGILRRDFTREGMEFFRTNDILIETDENVSWTLDGEYAEGQPKMRVENLHKAITFILPN